MRHLALLLIFWTGIAFADGEPCLKMEFEGVSDRGPLSDDGLKSYAKIEGGEAGVFRRNPSADKLQRIAVANAPDLAGRSFLSLKVNKESGPGGVVLKPFGPENSLAALCARDAQGRLAFNGVIDVLLRASRWDGIVLLDRSPDPQGGVRLVVDFKNGNIRCTMKSQQPCFDLDGNGEAEATQIQTPLANASMMAENQVYHVAVVFQTDDAGVLSIKTLRTSGDTGIDVDDKNAVVGVATAHIFGTLESGFSEGKFVIGSLSAPNEEVTVDIAGLRIYPSAMSRIPAFR